MTPLEEVAANQEERIESNIIDMKEAFYDREPDLKIVSDSQSQINKKPLYYRFIKRAFDVVFSLIVIVITFIPMLILSVFVAIDTKAFPIYSQERVGHKGPFKFFKMRSMVRDSDDLKKYFTPEQIEQWNKEHKVDSDPRITVLGSFLRRTSLDELPQFLNVLSGDLSVIGPRPVTLAETYEYGDAREEVLSCKPGITGWWAVTDRNNSTWQSGQRQARELFYVRHQSLGLDARVFVKTFKAMRRGR